MANDQRVDSSVPMVICGFVEFETNQPRIGLRDNMMGRASFRKVCEVRAAAKNIFREQGGSRLRHARHSLAKLACIGLHSFHKGLGTTSQKQQPLFSFRHFARRRSASEV